MEETAATVQFAKETKSSQYGTATLPLGLVVQVMNRTSIRHPSPSRKPGPKCLPVRPGNVRREHFAHAPAGRSLSSPCMMNPIRQIPTPIAWTACSPKNRPTPPRPDRYWLSFQWHSTHDFPFASTHHVGYQITSSIAIQLF